MRSSPEPTDQKSLPNPGFGNEAFPETRWTLVVRSQKDAPDSNHHLADLALEELCRLYWYPVYAFVRRSGHGDSEAQDLTQGFFEILLRRRDFEKVDCIKGRLRSYLLGAVKNYLAQEHGKRNRQKRGGDVEHLSMDLTDAEGRYRNEPADPIDPERLFERRWAMTIMQAAHCQLAAHYELAGKAHVFEALQESLTGDSSFDSSEAARTLGISEGAVRVAVHRLRKRFRDFVSQEVAETLSDEEDLEDELQRLFSAFG